MDSKLETVLSELATKLGTTVDHLYQLTIKQAKIETVGKIIQGILFVCFVIALIVLTVWLSHKKLETGGQYSSLTGYDCCSLFVGIMDVIAVALFVFELGNYYRNLAMLITNPEYWAIQDILASVRE